MTRLLDVFLSFFALLILSPVIILLVLIGFFDTGKPLFWQIRVGKDKNAFWLIKLRTMKLNTDNVASHLMDSNSITPFGHFLRRSKLDELPQLVNVLLGDMSLVGPRPNLFNQDELINERDIRGVYSVRPGITGLAQIQNIDMSTPKKLATLDAQMIAQFSVWMYLKLIWYTAKGKGRGDAVLPKRWN